MSSSDKRVFPWLHSVGAKGLSIISTLALVLLGVVDSAAPAAAEWGNDAALGHFRGQNRPPVRA